MSHMLSSLPATMNHKHQQLQHKKLILYLISQKKTVISWRSTESEICEERNLLRNQLLRKSFLNVNFAQVL